MLSWQSWAEPGHVQIPMVTVRNAVSVAMLGAAVAGAAGCHSAAAPPGRPEPPPLSPRPAAAPAAAPVYTRADVAFMQGMIGHHAQAIEMTALLDTRTSRPEMKLLAERIDVSQTDEIKMMKRWLEARSEAVPDDHAHHSPGATLMPGMLTADEMARLAAAKGADFDRLFLEAMIKHHEGALVMVAELFAAPGAAQDSEIFDFAAHVDADQRMEIARMVGLLKTMKDP